jgi:hypothetical protein
MNKGTKVRTALRIAVSIYTGLCVWEVAIAKLSEQLHTPWLVAVCAAAIVLSGLAVDVLTTYYNQDYTVEGDTGTKVTRQMKEIRGHVPVTVEEPEDSHIVELESEVQNGDE